MTSPDDSPREAAFFTTIRGWDIVRGPQGMIGGVAAGLGARIGLAPWPTRLLIILAGLFLFPIVALAYAAGWALLPDAEGNIVIQNFGRGVTNVGALIGIGVLTLLGLIGASDLRPFGRSWFGPDISAVDPGTFAQFVGIMFAFLVPLAFFAGVIALIVYFARRSSRGKVPEAGEPVYALTPTQARAAAGTAVPSTNASTSTATYPAATAKTAQLKRPAPPRVPGPGRGFYLALLGWLVLSIASVAWANREDLLAIYPVLAWGMVFMTGLGVIMIAVSLTGRRLGFMGFLGVVGVFCASLLLMRHDDLLDWYSSKASVADSIGEIVNEQFDATGDFAADYDTIYFGRSTCWYDPDGALIEAGTTARVAVPDPLEHDMEFDILAATTTVVIPRGTSLTVIPDGWAQATVYFADRGLACHFPGDEGPYVLLTNADDPVVTLTVPDDSTANTIVIEEN